MLIGRSVLASLMFAAAAAASAATAPRARTVAIGKHIDWTVGRNNAPSYYRVGDVNLRVQARDIRRSSQFVHARPRVTIQMAGFAPVQLDGSYSTGSASYNRLTVGRWNAKQSYVLLQSHTGGASCCVRAQVVFPEGRRLRTVMLGQWQGGFLDDPPTDIDKDGRVDFVFNDSAFFYRFAGFADSYAPPQIVNVVNGRVVDVSAYPAFRPLFQKAMQPRRRVCLGLKSQGQPRNGACAAYVASAARVGQTGRAWQEMLKAYDRRSMGYPYELRRFLIKRGYFRR